MQTINISAILRSIMSFVPGHPDKVETRYDDLRHGFKHCFAAYGDTPPVLTLSQYPRVASEIGAKAASSLRGIFLIVRERQNEIVVYWVSAPGHRGMFMVVRPFGQAGQVTTLFSLDEGNRCFDCQDPVFPRFHLVRRLSNRSCGPMERPYPTGSSHLPVLPCDLNLFPMWSLPPCCGRHFPSSKGKGS
jgi:hypothetical protein